MAGLSLPPCPPSLKPIQHLLKTGTEHEGRDPVVAYWCRLAALQAGLALDKSSKVQKKTCSNQPVLRIRDGYP
jgi:vacuolar protein sorting-associated protein VTA1